MIFRQLFDFESSTYTYILASRKGGEAVIIDPVLEHTNQYVRLISELSLKLVVVLDTHTHADHITASGALKEKTDCTITVGEMSKAEFVDVRLKEDEKLSLGNLHLTALYTPGHTDDSYCYVTDGMIFTGDTLLIRGTGRTDFQNGDALKAYDSLFKKVLCLPNETVVYPAHDYNGMTASTIGEEKKYNPRLQVKSADEYAEMMGKLNLPLPKKIKIAVPANLKCGLITPNFKNNDMLDLDFGITDKSF